MNVLSPKQMEQIKNQLLKEKVDLIKHFELNEHFGLNESQSDMTGELSMYDNHPADVATEIYERGKDIALNEHAEIYLEQVDRALENISIGHYGSCIACGIPIPFERLEALPTTDYCKAHSPDKKVSDRRPIEEKFLNPPFGRTSLDEHDDQTQFDGEDAWQIVERWGNSDSPALAEDPEVTDYDNMYIESDELVGCVESLESFLAVDLYGNPIPVVRNSHFRKYMASDEGDHELETNYEKPEELD